MKFEQLQDGKIVIEFSNETEKANFIRIFMTNDSLRAAEVMQILGITRQTLCHYVKRGLIKIDTNYTGGQYRYNRDSVMALLTK